MNAASSSIPPHLSGERPCDSEEAFDDLRVAIDSDKSSVFCVVCLKRRSAADQQEIHSHIIPDKCLADASSKRNIKAADLETAKKLGHRSITVKGYCKDCKKALGKAEAYFGPYVRHCSLPSLHSLVSVPPTSPRKLRRGA